MTEPTEFVAVSTLYDDRQVFHEVEDGQPACSPSRVDEFEIVPKGSVPGFDRCKHCTGEAQASGGQGSTLAAKLAAADPEEVTSR